MNDFAKKTIKALAKKGIRFIGPVAIPNAETGLWANCDRAYSLDNNGQGQIRTFAEVLNLAGTETVGSRRLLALGK